MHVPTLVSRFAVLALPVLLLAGCKSDSTGPNTSANLAGTYNLQSITFPGLPAMTPPAVTGTFVLTATTYTVTLNLPAQLGGTQQDAGTYTLSGNNWSQTSTVTGCPSACLQSVGTYSLSGNTLTVNVTTQGNQVVTVWAKQ